MACEDASYSLKKEKEVLASDDDLCTGQSIDLQKKASDYGGRVFPRRGSKEALRPSAQVSPEAPCDRQVSRGRKIRTGQLSKVLKHNSAAPFSWLCHLLNLSTILYLNRWFFCFEKFENYL